MTNICRVTEVDGGFCTLATLRQEACRNCGANCVGCGKVVTVRTENTLGAEVGDEVEVTTSSAKFLTLCALIFLVPVLMGILVLFLVGAAFGERAGAWCALVAFCLALAGGVFLVRAKRAALGVRMARIVTKQSKG